MRLCLLLGIVVIVSSCESHQPPQQTYVGFEWSDLDTTVRPQDDLFHYANGGWISRAQIPADRGSWTSFTEVSAQNDLIMRELLQEVSSNAKYVEGTDYRKAADFYTVGMDSIKAEKAGADVLRPTLSAINKINSMDALQTYLGENELRAGSAFFNISVNADAMDNKKHAVYLTSARLGLPEREYYLRGDESSRKIRDKYLDHISTMFVLLGETHEWAERAAEKILATESRLARAMLSREEKRNPKGVYNKRSIAQLYTVVPSWKWDTYFEQLQIKTDSVIIEQPDFMRECHRIFELERWSDLQAYLKWALIREAAPYLNYSFFIQDFEFNNKYFLGADKLRPRWKRVLEVTNRYLGEVIGQLYVEKTFSPDTKEKVLEMAENIKLATAHRIKTLDWMSDTTKMLALKKLSRVNVKVGYPEEWKSYAGLVVEKTPEGSTYYQNVVNASMWMVRQQFNKLSNPVSRKEWTVTPQTANAFYNYKLNEIYLPAGILHPPFYSRQRDEAINYGGIGAIIGHEIVHGFDDAGSQFNENGSLKNWWMEEDIVRFKQKGFAITAQLNDYDALVGDYGSGEFSLGENIADLGGLSVAYEGLQRYMRENGNLEVIDGHTATQRFFVSWATIWRSKARAASLKTAVATDPHAPNEYRVNGPVSNLHSFYEAFSLGSGDELYREEPERIVIW